MRNVTRAKIPKSLKDNSTVWTNELIKEIGIKGSYEAVADSYKNKYRQDDIKDTLEEMYNHHCCYCESLIGAGLSTYGRIEHLKPKSKFPEHCYDWDNLHWSCEVCNTSYKRTEWDSVHPILDPCKDVISSHLVYDAATGMYDEVNSSDRGRTTIKHTGLNRADLAKARRLLFIRLTNDYREYKSNGNADKFINYYNLIKEDLDYPSVYDAFLEAVDS